EGFSRVIVNFLLLEVDRQLVAGIKFYEFKQPVNPLFRQTDGKEPVLKTVVIEDVGKRRSENRAKSIITQGPGRVFTGRAAAEIRASQQDAGPLESRRVQFKRHVGLAIEVVSPIVKKELPKTGALDAFQELLGDDLVRVDVDAIQGCDNSAVHCKWFHARSHFLMSTKRPSMAA